MATRKGLEPSTSSVTGWHSKPTELPGQIIGGNNRARTCDPLLVRQMLSQLSYAPPPCRAHGTYYIINESSPFVKGCFSFFSPKCARGNPSPLRKPAADDRQGGRPLTIPHIVSDCRLSDSGMGTRIPGPRADDYRGRRGGAEPRPGVSARTFGCTKIKKYNVYAKNITIFLDFWFHHRYNNESFSHITACPRQGQRGSARGKSPACKKEGWKHP